MFRITIDPSEQNGLKKALQLMVDKPVTLRRDKVGASIGGLGDDVLIQVNRALSVWLGIA